MEGLTRGGLEASIRMGEMAVHGQGGVLRTLLGSCVGVALYDRRLRIGGLAHIVLPQARGQPEMPGKFVDTAIPALMQQMESLVGQPLRLSARIAGGASMFSNAVMVNIGMQNIESCEKLLREFRIPIVARHCGGEQGRRMRFDTGSGQVWIEVVGQSTIEL